MSSWQTLATFRDAAVPKLNNLRRAAAAGLRVPPTWWAAAHAADPTTPPPEIGPGPLIVRAASPTEDGHTTSNAGQLLSVRVDRRDDFADAVRRVVAALPKDAHGRPRGAAFVQPFVTADEAGVAFFDDFYYERTTTAGSNERLTAGQARGEVRRGHREPGEAWSTWLDAVYAVFGEEAGGDRRLDVEFARDAEGYLLLQVRPALFPVVRNQTLTQANVKETFGDWPSPWTTASLVEAGQDLTLLCAIEPAFTRWEECFAVEVGERPWINLSFMLRWQDYSGVPRSFVLQAIGGELEGVPAGAWVPSRLLRRLLPSLVRGFWYAPRQILTVRRDLRRLDRAIEAARGLDALYRATAQSWALGFQTALAIIGLLAALAWVRKVLRLPSAARVVTKDLMDDYQRLAALPDPAQRLAGLDAWLARYGHRGPRESDMAQPRFAELRDVLRQDLLAAQAPAPPPSTSRGLHRLLRPLHCMDEFREWFRDAAVRRWQRLRQLVLAEGARLVAGGELDDPADVFWLRGSDLHGPLPLRAAVAAARERRRAVANVQLPLTASREFVQDRLTKAEEVRWKADDRHVFPGIALGPAVVEGRAVKADDLTALLVEASRNGGFGTDAILVVPSLEPSWAVVFPRFAGVVAELGGELSHASILLREARRPAVVNCRGVFGRVRTGDRLRLDGARGTVEVLDEVVRG
jgi:rifampicin phosphotransferase